METTRLILLLLLRGVPALALPWVAGADPVLPLPEPDRRMIVRNLGQGLVGPAVPAPVLERPANYFRLVPGAGYFKIVHGPGEGRRESFHLSAEPWDPGRSRWRYRMGEDEAAFLEIRPDGSLVLTGTHEIKDGALARYDPPEPFLLKGLAPGEERRQRMEVRVYDADEPDEVRHQGLLTVVHRYVGAYRFNGPAGTYPAVLMKSTFSGRVGPARLEDVQYRFFAPGIGLLAAIERRQVSAFWLYRTNVEIARVLAEPAECRPRPAEPC